MERRDLNSAFQIPHIAHFTVLSFPYLRSKHSRQHEKSDFYQFTIKELSTDFTHQPFPKSNVFQVKN